MSSYRNLQIFTAVLALIPTLSGIVTLMGVHDPLYTALALPDDPLLDSNLRFFGDVWLGLGLAVFWMLPRLSEQTALFRVVWGAIFLGGVGRLLSMSVVGLPPAPFIAFTLLEIVGAPLFVVWHARVVRSSTVSGQAA